MKELVSKKTAREMGVLFGLVSLYIESGKPVGSQTLLENGFKNLSSATIRNYFAKLEREGYLVQPHTSGGRVPTEKGFESYVAHLLAEGLHFPLDEEALGQALAGSTEEIASYLSRVAEKLSDLSQCAVFLSAPRFDQDFIREVKLVQVDPTRLLSVAITDFGLVKTELIYLDQPVALPFLRTTEEYFAWRMNKGEKPFFASEKEAKAGARIYNEVMVRHLVGYANFSQEDIVRTGLAKLLNFPEFTDAMRLTASLSLLEDEAKMRSILREAKELKVWIGSSIMQETDIAVIAAPYKIHDRICGAIALLGPMRLPYLPLMALLERFAANLSHHLTDTLYKFKISFRQPPVKGLEKQP